jgi:hypothetical protein
MKQNTIISASTVGVSVVIAAVIFVAQSPSILQGNLTMPEPTDMMRTDDVQPDLAMPVDTMLPEDGLGPEELADLADDDVFVPGEFDQIIADDTALSDDNGVEDVYFGDGPTGGGPAGGNAASVCKNETVSKHGNNVGKGTGIDLDPTKAIAAAKAQATKMAQDTCKKIEKNPDAIDPATSQLIVPACKPSDKCVSTGVTAAYTDDKNNPVQVTLTQPYKTNKKWKAEYTTSGTCKSTRTCAKK